VNNAPKAHHAAVSPPEYRLPLVSEAKTTQQCVSWILNSLNHVSFDAFPTFVVICPLYEVVFFLHGWVGDVGAIGVIFDLLQLEIAWLQEILV